MAHKLMSASEVERIASICHAANRQYCLTLGDKSQPEWLKAPEWQKESAMDGVRLHLTELFEGREVTPSASHGAWMQAKLADGWKYGEVKNPEKKEHPCIVPYDQLPFEQKVKDYLFAAVVKAYFTAVTKT